MKETYNTCGCTTMTGLPCARKVKAGEKYCYQHKYCDKPILLREKHRLKERIASYLHNVKKLPGADKDVMSLIKKGFQEEYRRQLTFPREGRRAFVHHVPKKIVDLKDELEEHTEEEFNTALTYLTKIGAKLVYGDFVVFDSIAGYRNSGVTIFDGTKIIDLYYDIDDYGSLPPQFHVIEDNVPAEYWDFIEHNSIVWFNHLPVLDQLLANIKHKGGMVYTTFIYEDEEFRIILDYFDDEDITEALSLDIDGPSTLNESQFDEIKGLFKTILSNKLLIFHYKSQFLPKVRNPYTIFIQSQQAIP